MLCTMKIKLSTNEEQHRKLLLTMKRFNESCNYISVIAFENKAFGQIKLHKMTYYKVREEFGVSAQMAVRAIGKVVESYKSSKKNAHTFRDTGAIVYDKHILSFKGVDEVSILTLEGRIKVPMIISSYHKGVMQGRRIRGQADLILQEGIFYLLLIVDTPETEEFNPYGAIGVDLGIKNIAVDSTGEVFSGRTLNSMRERYSKIRRKLQTKGTKSAKRLLKKRKRKEQRFARNTNHIVSKKIVRKAKDTGNLISLEDLYGIRNRTQKTVKKAQRSKHSSWSFYQLQSFIQYKAKIVGVPVVFVDPKYTSQTCFACGHVAKENRKTQSEFVCVSCGHADNADHNAACNIASRAIVS